MTNLERKAVTTLVAAQMLGVSDESIKKYLVSGKLEGFKLPHGHFRIFLDSIEAMKNQPAKVESVYNPDDWD